MGRVFVYGTLRRGERNHALLDLARFAGAVRTSPRYVLRDLDTHPALFEHGSDAIAGELWECDERVLARLDAFESGDDDYERRSVELADGAVADAWFAPARASSAPRIESGDWTAHLDARATELSCIAIDWSGDATASGQRRKIWCAVARRGKLVGLAAGRTREELVRELEQRIRTERELALGFDFCFALPAWHARELGCRTASDVWRLVEQNGEQWLAGTHSPFWRRKRPEHSSERSPWRRTESEGSDRPLSVHQLVGVQVGTGSLRGMPYLPRLRAAGAAIWPFDAARLPVVVEIYPRVFTGPVLKRDANARALELRRFTRDALSDELRERAASSDDAFDAALSALGMSAAARELVRLRPARDDVDALEGRIFRPAQRR